ncbi:Xyloglucan endotransglucosylase protein 1-like protein [Drosera capensis]
MQMQSKRYVALANFLVVLSCFMVVGHGNLYQYLDVTWGEGRGRIIDNGDLLTLSLDQFSGSGFQSYSQYLFGRFDMNIKLVPGNSAGTVTTFYLSSEGATHDEIDFEFLGNLSGQPYIVHTNLYAEGQGNREQQFYLWFDPTADFHTYTVLWNPNLVAWYVDGTPIRVFRNMESSGIPFPHNQAMRTYGSIWDGDSWATEGGRIKTNWTNAPFAASFANYIPNGCVSSTASFCNNVNPTGTWYSQELDSTSQARLTWVQKNYMIYNYCTDYSRFPQGLPPECSLQTTS